jgi:hypothetical protein
MIAIATVGALLALPNGCGVIILVGCLPILAVISAQWLVFRGHRRVAAIGFWALAGLMNLLYVACCVAPDMYLLISDNYTSH